MDLEKLKEKIDAADVVEEILDLSKKVFDKNSGDVKKVVEMFIAKAYLMGKKNQAKIVSDD